MKADRVIFGEHWGSHTKSSNVWRGGKRSCERRQPYRQYRKMIEDSVDGLLFDTGDVPGLRAALDRLISDETLRTSLGAAALERVDQRFSAEAYVADLERCIQKIEGRAASTSPANPPRSPRPRPLASMVRSPG